MQKLFCLSLTNIGQQLSSFCAFFTIEKNIFSDQNCVQHAFTAKNSLKPKAIAFYLSVL